MNLFRNVILRLGPVKAGSLVRFLGFEGNIGSDGSDEAGLVELVLVSELCIHILELVKLSAGDVVTSGVEESQQFFVIEGKADFSYVAAVLSLINHPGYTCHFARDFLN